MDKLNLSFLLNHQVERSIKQLDIMSLHFKEEVHNEDINLGITHA